MNPEPPPIADPHSTAPIKAKRFRPSRRVWKALALVWMVVATFVACTDVQMVFGNYSDVVAGLAGISVVACMVFIKGFPSRAK